LGSFFALRRATSAWARSRSFESSDGRAYGYRDAEYLTLKIVAAFRRR
jgi:hypothetical protein